MISILDDYDLGRIVGYKECSFDELCEILRHPTVTGEKGAAGKYSPAKYSADRRRNADVVQINLLVVDYDDVPEADILAAISGPLQGLKYALHTTYSDVADPNSRRMRLLVELSRPVLPKEWRVFRKAVDERFGLPSDPQSLDLARFYYAPSIQVEGAPFEYLDWRETTSSASPLDVDDLLADVAMDSGCAQEISYAPADPHEPTPSTSELNVPGVQAITRTDTVSIDAVRDYAKSLARRPPTKSGDPRELGKALLKVCDGEDWGVSGTRHGLAVQLTARLVYKFPRATLESLANIWVLSCEAAATAGSKTPETHDTILRLLRDADIKKQASDEARDEAISNLVGTAPRGTATTHTLATVIDNPTLVEIGVRAGLGRAPYDNEWILQQNDTYWFLGREGYGRAYSKSEADTIYLQLLKDTPVEVKRFREKDGMPITRELRDLARQYGSIVHDVYYVQAPNSTYDPDSRALRLGCAWPTVRESVFSPRVDAYLRRFLSRDDNLNAGMQWLASYLRPELNIRLLFMVGKQQAGKSTILRSLAECYSGGQGLPVEQVYKFNRNLLTSPLIYADEESSLRLGTIRKLLGGVGVQIRALYKDAVAWKVNPRVVFTANDFTAFDAQGLTSNTALVATADRFLFISADSSARELIPSGEYWLDFVQCEFPAHLKWMSRNVEVVSEGRFAGVQNSSHGQAILATQVSSSMTLCDIAVDWLMEQRGVKALTPSQAQLARISGGAVQLSRKYIQARWKDITGRHPDPQELSAALTSCGVPVRDKFTRFWQIDTACLLQHAESTACADPDVIRELLAGPTGPVSETTIGQKAS